jgi:hypothetical protein
LDTFGYDNIRKWMAEANAAMEGEMCAQALVWEATNRRVDPVGGSHGIYQALEYNANQMNSIIGARDDEIVQLTGMIANLSHLYLILMLRY